MAKRGGNYMYKVVKRDGKICDFRMEKNQCCHY